MSLLGREIVTLQFGNYSNYIGTHWWNLQEAAFSYDLKKPTDINNDVLFREGQTYQGEVTFTPRLVLADVQGSLGTLPEDGGLYDKIQQPDTSFALWHQDKVKIEASPPVEKNEYLTDLKKQESQVNCSEEVGEGSSQASNSCTSLKKRYNLENSVNYWSDYLGTLFHPRTLAITNEYKLNDDDKPFNCFGLGTSLWKLPSYQEDVIERIRGYMEEADNLQGFHVLLDGHDGFSGLGCGCLQHISDEYSSKAVMAFLCLPSHYEASSALQESRRVVNVALAVSSLPELASLFCPVSTMKEGWRTPTQTRTYPYLKYNAELDYHSSAVIAAGLETLTLSYRLRESSLRLGDVTNGLRVVGRAAASASVSLPFPMHREQSLMKTLELWNGPLFHSMTPYCDLARIDLQSLCIRGVPKSRMFENISSGTDVHNPAYSCRSVEEMIKLFISCDLLGSPPAHVFSSDVTLKTRAPFPAIIDEQLIASDGSLIEFTNDQGKGVNEATSLSGLHSSRDLTEMLSTLHCEAKRVNIKLLHGLADSGIELLEWQEKMEQILCLSECYTD